MSQITSGIRAILSNPVVYSSFQRLMGADKLWSMLAKDFIKPFSGMRVLDIGCGPGDILTYLPEVDYHGFDISPAYIAKAQKNLSHKGKFYCREFSAAELPNVPKCDVVLACGLLHHLEDTAAIEIFALASQALKPGGRFITIDPCFDSAQNKLARFLVSKDRGQNVRFQHEYAALAEQVFKSPEIEVRHRTWIPYTHCLMSCTKI